MILLISTCSWFENETRIL